MDILHALTKNVLGDVDESEEFQALQEQMNDRFRKTFPSRNESEITSSTLLRKRQDVAARTIQRAFRHYLEQKYRLQGSRPSASASPMNYLRDLSQHILGLPRRLSITRSASKLSIRSATAGPSPSPNYQRRRSARANSVEPGMLEQIRTSSSFDSVSSNGSTPSKKVELSRPPTPSILISTPVIHVRSPSPCPQIFEEES